MELLVSLIALAFLASIWSQLQVQARLAEARIIARLKALHLAASYLDQLRAGVEKPVTVKKCIQGFKLSCRVQAIPESIYLWHVTVEVVSKQFPEQIVSLSACGRYL